MPGFFCDSSGIVKRYVNEVGSGWVERITDPASGHVIFIAWITGVEVVSALVRQARSGNLKATALAPALADFQHDFAVQYRKTGISPRIVIEAMTLAERHGLRGYDAVQL